MTWKCTRACTQHTHPVLKIQDSSHKGHSQVVDYARRRAQILGMFYRQPVQPAPSVDSPCLSLTVSCHDNVHGRWFQQRSKTASYAHGALGPVFERVTRRSWTRAAQKQEKPTQGAHIRAMVSGWPVQRQHADKKQQRIETSDAHRQG